MGGSDVFQMKIIYIKVKNNRRVGQNFLECGFPDIFQDGSQARGVLNFRPLLPLGPRLRPGQHVFVHRAHDLFRGLFRLSSLLIKRKIFLCSWFPRAPAKQTPWNENTKHYKDWGTSRRSDIEAPFRVNRWQSFSLLISEKAGRVERESPIHRAQPHIGS